MRTMAEVVGRVWCTPTVPVLPCVGTRGRGLPDQEMCTISLRRSPDKITLRCSSTNGELKTCQWMDHLSISIRSQWTRHLSVFLTFA